MAEFRIVATLVAGGSILNGKGQKEVSRLVKMFYVFFFLVFFFLFNFN